MEEAIVTSRPPRSTPDRKTRRNPCSLEEGGGEGRVHLIREGRNLLLPAIACRCPRFLFLIPTSISLALLERDGDTNTAFGGRWIPTLDLMLILQFSLPSLRQPKAGRGRRGEEGGRWQLGPPPPPLLLPIQEIRGTDSLSLVIILVLMPSGRPCIRRGAGYLICHPINTAIAVK